MYNNLNICSNRRILNIFKKILDIINETYRMHIVTLFCTMCIRK